MDTISCIIVAGGKGSRMGGEKPKVLMELRGKPLLGHCIEKVAELGIEDIVVVDGFKHDEIRAYLEVNWANLKIKSVHQEVQDGNAKAVELGLAAINPSSSDVLILYGDDSALYRIKTISSCIDEHRSSQAPATVATINSKVNPQLAGLEVDKDNYIHGIIKVTEIAERGLTEVVLLCGMVVFRKEDLMRCLEKIEFNPRKQEYLFTDFITVLSEAKSPAKSFFIMDTNEWNSVNTPDELHEAERKFGVLYGKSE